jgi:hypothetical protein
VWRLLAWLRLHVQLPQLFVFVGLMSSLPWLDEKLFRLLIQVQAAVVRENPVGHGMDYVHIYLTIAKAEA